MSNWIPPYLSEAKEFEHMCSNLFHAVYKKTTNDGLFGRTGFPQFGVDFLVSTVDGVRAYQCKNTDTFDITAYKKELDKLASYSGKLLSYSVLTYAESRTEVCQWVAETSSDREKDGLCPISILFRSDLAHMLKSHPALLKRYWPHTYRTNANLESDRMEALESALPSASYQVRVEKDPSGKIISSAIVSAHTRDLIKQRLHLPTKPIMEAFLKGESALILKDDVTIHIPENITQAFENTTVTIPFNQNLIFTPKKLTIRAEWVMLPKDDSYSASENEMRALQKLEFDPILLTQNAGEMSVALKFVDHAIDADLQKEGCSFRMDIAGRTPVEVLSSYQKFKTLVENSLGVIRFSGQIYRAFSLQTTFDADAYIQELLEACCFIQQHTNWSLVFPHAFTEQHEQDVWDVFNYLKAGKEKFLPKKMKRVTRERRLLAEAWVARVSLPCKINFEPRQHVFWGAPVSFQKKSR